FTVGITKEGVLEFKVQGEDITPAELAGLLYYADFQVKKLLDTQFKSADTLCLLGISKVLDKLNKEKE
ncbi:hypothetical protein LRR18_17370, partial [Mangrovimonas sp. AS39]|uniref:hypothetical protein n=1 Tax=Mangrovimonas futianensis TaxID=2895523 RepID=UPI001E588C9A